MLNATDVRISEETQYDRIWVVGPYLFTNGLNMAEQLKTQNSPVKATELKGCFPHLRLLLVYNHEA